MAECGRYRELTARVTVEPGRNVTNKWHFVALDGTFLEGHSAISPRSVLTMR